MPWWPLRLATVLLFFFVLGYVLAGVALGADGARLPSPDWRDLIVALIGAVLGWATRWLGPRG